MLSILSCCKLVDLPILLLMLRCLLPIVGILIALLPVINQAAPTDKTDDVLLPRSDPPRGRPWPIPKGGPVPGWDEWSRRIAEDAQTNEGTGSTEAMAYRRIFPPSLRDVEAVSDCW